MGDKPKRKRKHNDFHVEEDYEQLPRKRLGEEKQFRVLLPIKSKEKGIITQVEEVQSEENKEDEKGWSVRRTYLRLTNLFSFIKYDFCR